MGISTRNLIEQVLNAEAAPAKRRHRQTGHHDMEDVAIILGGLSNNQVLAFVYAGLLRTEVDETLEPLVTTPALVQFLELHGQLLMPAILQANINALKAKMAGSDETAEPAQ